MSNGERNKAADRARAARLEAQLRGNLKKRKEQARARARSASGQGGAGTAGDARDGLGEEAGE